jgi:hypothetical protein
MRKLFLSIALSLMLLGTAAVSFAEVERTSKEAADADEHVKFLESPLVPHNVIAWLWGHVPTIVVVIVAMVLLQWLVRVASRQVRHADDFASSGNPHLASLGGAAAGGLAVAFLLGGEEFDRGGLRAASYFRNRFSRATPTSFARAG